MICENDILIIPEEYKNMSIEENELDKNKILKELKIQNLKKKQNKENKNNIVFNL